VPGEEQHLGAVLRKALALATEVDIVAAFVQPAGLEHLVDDLRDALARGARVRLLSGEYMNVTSPDALRRQRSLRTIQAHENTSFRSRSWGAAGLQVCPARAR
jgi:HKD family nuclease